MFKQTRYSNLISIYIKDKTLMKKMEKKMQMSDASQYGPKLWGYASSLQQTQMRAHVIAFMYF